MTIIAGCISIAMGEDRKKATTAAEPPKLRVGQVIYDQKKQKSHCFSEAFLAQVDRQTALRVHHRLENVPLESAKLFNHPLVVMHGTGKFTLTKAQTQNLARYLKRGGMLLASSMCSNKEWDASFRAAMAKVLPKTKFEPIPVKHPMFRTLYDIKSVRTVKKAEHPIVGVKLKGRLAVVYSPIDLRDAHNLAKECCCCGANEIRNAMPINANVLVYAVTR